MTEDRVIARIRKWAGRRPGLVGIGDDCCVYRGMLFTTDLMLEGVHFRREWHSATVVGWRTLARGLSDIAAMGGRPRICLVSLALAPWTDTRWVDGCYRGLMALARETGTALAGGDLGHAERVAADIVVCGEAPRQPLRRDQARVGDEIWVSGRLGGSALGLETRRGAAWRKHARPEPRLALGKFLIGRAHAAMDISDGLALDLHRLCTASGCAAEIESVPVFRGASLEQALSGGEDYELLFTAPAGAKLPREFKGVELSRIGRVVKGGAGAVRFEGKPLAPRGYDHLRAVVHNQPD